MSRKNNLGLPEPEKAEFLDIFILMAFKISCLAEWSMIFFNTSGPDQTGVDLCMPRLLSPLCHLYTILT